VHNVIVVSDMHFGCQFGLFPSYVKCKLDGGGYYQPSALQVAVAQWWDIFWEEWVPMVTRKEPYAVVINGDVNDGRHHNSTTQITQNLADQSKLAIDGLKPKLKKATHLFMVRGTEAHCGQSSENEELVAEGLGALPDACGNYCRPELWLRVGSGLVHFLHHIGTAGSTAYETTALMREYGEACSEAGRWGHAAPNVVVRSHRHRHSETRVPTKQGYGVCFTTAGWQLKMLDLATPLPTPKGWTTMGEVSIGDILFDEKGRQCSVLAVRPVHPAPKSFLVIFSNGETVKACADHLWLTTAAVDKPGKPGHGGEKRPLTRVRTTQEIYDTLTFGRKKDHNHKLIMPSPLRLSSKRLPIDPYVLGCWLGDGDSDSARLTCHSDDAEHYRSEFLKSGYSLSEQKVKADKCPRFAIQRLDESGRPVAKANPDNFQRVLKHCGLLHNKHIPMQFLRGSTPQRLALLQGLMDTDGHPDRPGRAIFFSTTMSHIRDGMSDLLAGLGVKYTIVRRKGLLKGHPAASDFWLFRFFISPDILPVFRLARKLCRVPWASSRKTAQKSRVVHFTSVTPCDPVPMRCIAVDSPSKLYRFGRTMLYTHNTPFVHKIAGARNTTPQMGGSLIRWGDEELYTRHKTWNITRDEPEVLQI